MLPNDLVAVAYGNDTLYGGRGVAVNDNKKERVAP
jgi:hypothetical protein